MSWGSEGGAEVEEKWCMWSSFLIGFGIVYYISWGSEGGAEVVEKGCIWSRFILGSVDRLLAEHPTPHPNWESRPGTPLVIFLGVGGGPRIPLGARVRDAHPPWVGYQA